MSLEMAHKVIVPQKKIMSRSFLNSGTLIVKKIDIIIIITSGIVFFYKALYKVLKSSRGPCKSHIYRYFRKISISVYSICNLFHVIELSTI
jgi:hypothetical protein